MPGFIYMWYAWILTTIQILLELARNVLRLVPGWVPVLPNWGPKRFDGKERIDGKVVVITGGNTGIGKETAKDMVKRGAKVIIGCRDINKGESAKYEILSEVKDATIVIKHLDLASLSSVRRFAEELSNQEPVIDILINNAGVMMCPKSTTEDGFELQLATNHLGHFLLTLLLLEPLKKSAAGRIINTSSIAYGAGDIHFDDIHLDKSYTPTRAYCQSKLAVVMISQELARRLSGTNIRVYAVHPGLVATELSRHLTGLKALALNLLSLIILMPVDFGAQTTIRCAVGDEVAKENGEWYKNCENACLLSHAKDEKVAKKLWQVSCEMVKVDDKLKLD